MSFPSELLVSALFMGITMAVMGARLVVRKCKRLGFNYGDRLTIAAIVCLVISLESAIIIGYYGSNSMWSEVSNKLTSNLTVRNSPD